MNQRTASPKHRRRGKIFLIVLAALAVLLVAAYPIIANTVLAFGGVQMATSGTDTIAIDFRRAWSFWPGRVYVEGARITMQDRNVQFAMEIASADVTVDLLAFTRRTFHATKVRASGISFRFRHRIEHEALGFPFVAALPPIPEFPDPPLREFGPPAAPLDEAHLEGLTLDLGVERYCRWTDVQILDARGGPFMAEGRVQIEPGETRGALLLRLANLKPVSLGLNFVEDYSHTAPLVGGSWLEKHLVPLTSAATEKHDRRCVPQPPKCR